MLQYTYIVQRISQTQQLLSHKNIILGRHVSTIFESFSGPPLGGPEDDSNAIFIKLVKSSKFTLK